MQQSMAWRLSVLGGWNRGPTHAQSKWWSVADQAFDLDELREVAVKIHQLNSTWNEAKKASYVRHALREYSIHRGLAHPRIVALLDIFEIDAHTFATVLDLCTGGDLDTHLKEHQV